MAENQKSNWAKTEEQLFTDYCIDQLDGWAAAKTKSDPGYGESLKRYNNLLDRAAALPGADRELLERLGDARAALCACSDIPNYLQGWRDCLLLLKRVGIL